MRSQLPAIACLVTVDSMQPRTFQAPAFGELFVMLDGGDLLVAQASPAAFKQLARATVLSGTCWTVPVVADGRVYCRNQQGDLVAVDLR